MNGRKMSSKEKKRLVREYISRVNPYQKPTPLKFDLRGYAAYLEENNISGKDVSDDILKMFSR